MYEFGVPTFLEKPDRLIWDFSPPGESLSGQNGSCILRWVWGLPLCFPFVSLMLKLNASSSLSQYPCCRFSDSLCASFINASLTLILRQRPS